MSSVNKDVVSDLNIYFGDTDSNFRSSLYEIERVKQNVDGFNEWRRQQELAAKNGDTQIHR